MLQLTPPQREQAAKMHAILEDMSARSTQMIELIDRMAERRKQEYNDKLMWLLDHRATESKLTPTHM